MEVAVRTSEAVELTGLSRQKLWALVAQNKLSRPEYRTARDRRWVLQELLLLRRLHERQDERRRLEQEGA